MVNMATKHYKGMMSIVDRLEKSRIADYDYIEFNHEYPEDACALIGELDVFSIKNGHLSIFEFKSTYSSHSRQKALNQLKRAKDYISTNGLVVDGQNTRFRKDMISLFYVTPGRYEWINYNKISDGKQKLDSCQHLDDLVKLEKKVIDRHLEEHMYYNGIESKNEAVVDFNDKYGWLMREIYCGEICPDAGFCQVYDNFIAKWDKE